MAVTWLEPKEKLEMPLSENAYSPRDLILLGSVIDTRSDIDRQYTCID
jgi:hypothetical protein